MTPICSKIAPWMTLVVNFFLEFGTLTKWPKLHIDSKKCVRLKKQYRAAIGHHHVATVSISRAWEIQWKKNQPFSSYFSPSLFVFLVLTFCSFLHVLTWFFIILLLNLPEFLHKNHVMTTTSRFFQDFASRIIVGIHTLDARVFQECEFLKIFDDLNSITLCSPPRKVYPSLVIFFSNLYFIVWIIYSDVRKHKIPLPWEDFANILDLPHDRSLFNLEE